MELHLLTQSTFKVETARLAWEPLGITVKQTAVGIPEIQASTNLEIARHTAITAATLLHHPVVREDHGFFLNAIPGFPGPFMAYIEKAVEPRWILKLLEGNHDRTAYFEMAIVYATPDGKTKEYVEKVPATIAMEVSAGSNEFNWDGIICLGADSRPLAEYPVKDRYHYFTGNYQRLAHDLMAGN